MMRATRLATLAAIVTAGCGMTAASPDDDPDTGEISSTLEQQVLCNEVFSLGGAQALAACFARVAPGGTVLLPAGVNLVLETPVVITKSMILTTAGKGPGQSCDPRTAHSCAVIHTSPTSAQFNDPVTPAVTISASDVSLRNLELNFHLRSTGVRVHSGVRFSAYDVALQNARRSAMEVEGTGSDGMILERNVFYNNGAREPTHTMVSDGLTLLSGNGVRIAGNWFVDNTDVQLIVGACTSCVIAGNDIRNSGNPARASFAALALHSFIGTQSAVFTGTDIAGNVIDCSPARSCGYGIYLGDYSWFPAGPSNPVNGGHIHGNSVSYAQIGMYIDHAVNTRIDDDNGFFIPGGVFPCLTPNPGHYGAAVLSLIEDPRIGGLIQIDFSTALNLFVNHRINQNLRGCVPNGY